MNRVKVVIYGREYSILTEGPTEYLKEIAATLDQALTDVLESDSNMSIIQALVLCSLSYLDTARKEEENADNLRTQVQTYLDEVTAMKAEINASIIFYFRKTFTYNVFIINQYSLSWVFQIPEVGINKDYLLST